MTTARTKTERLEARISREQKELFQKAAEIRGNTLTEFVVSAVQEAAARAIREHELLELGAQDREVLINALLNPPEPDEALRRAAHEYRKFVGL